MSRPFRLIPYLIAGLIVLASEKAFAYSSPSFLHTSGYPSAGMLVLHAALLSILIGSTQAFIARRFADGRSLRSLAIPLSILAFLGASIGVYKLIASWWNIIPFFIVAVLFEALLLRIFKVLGPVPGKTCLKASFFMNTATCAFLAAVVLLFGSTFFNPPKSYEDKSLRNELPGSLLLTGGFGREQLYIARNKLVEASAEALAASCSSAPSNHFDLIKGSSKGHWAIYDKIARKRRFEFSKRIDKLTLEVSSPDGRFVVCSEEPGEIQLIDAKWHKVRPQLDKPRPKGCKWIQKGSLGALHLVDLKAGTLRSFAFGKNPCFSPSRDRLAWVTSDVVEQRNRLLERSRVNIFDLRHRRLRSFTLPDPFAGRLVWSPNGRYLAYTAKRPDPISEGDRTFARVITTDGKRSVTLRCIPESRRFSWLP